MSNALSTTLIPPMKTTLPREGDWLLLGSLSVTSNESFRMPYGVLSEAETPTRYAPTHPLKDYLDEQGWSRRIESKAKDRVPPEEIPYEEE